MVLLGLIWFHVASLELTWTLSVPFNPLGLIWTYLVLLGFAWFHVDSLGLTGSHLVSLGFTWIDLDSQASQGHKRGIPAAKREKGSRARANLKPVPTLHPERAHARTNRNRNRFPSWTHPPNLRYQALEQFIALALNDPAICTLHMV